MLIAFLLTFAITRAVTRRIRARSESSAAAGDGPGDAGPTAGKAGQAGQASPPGQAKRRGLGDVYIGGVHVHHQVWGILLVLVSGLAEFRYAPPAPWNSVLAAAFGAGAALTLDEFALWFTLDDVYWKESGRKSIDAILIASALGVALLVQAAPSGTASRHATAAAIGSVLFTIALDLALSILCIAKGKLATGMLGVVVPVVSLIGAIRLAKPASPWARRRYRGAKLARSQRRFGPAYQRRHDRLRDLIGGRPTMGRPSRDPARR